LAFQDWQDFLLNRFCELSGLSFFGPDGNNPAEHDIAPQNGFAVKQMLILAYFKGQLLKNGAGLDRCKKSRTTKKARRSAP
jgi:hypothetical protein